MAWGCASLFPPVPTRAKPAHQGGMVVLTTEASVACSRIPINERSEPTGLIKPSIMNAFDHQTNPDLCRTAYLLADASAARAGRVFAGSVLADWRLSAATPD